MKRKLQIKNHKSFMGSNYYFKTNHCLMCDRCDRRHIGKSSHGWPFIFRKWDDDTFKVHSWREWLLKFESNGSIEDEYGESVSVNQFINLVSIKQSNPIHDRSGLESDLDGFWFFDGEFF
jgi:hypothetical protein